MSHLQFQKFAKALNLDRLKEKIVNGDPTITHTKNRWNAAQATEAILQYKRYLWLIRKYKKKYKHLPPSAEIDSIWHAHILDTKMYQKDCKRLLGFFLHHDPYFGLNGKRDRKNLDSGFAQTQYLYKKEFGEFIYSI